MVTINSYGGSRQLAKTTSATDPYTSTFTSDYYYGYPVSYIRESLGYEPILPNDNPIKKKTFEDKLQDEIDEWLSIFKES